MSTIRPAVSAEEAMRIANDYEEMAYRLYEERLFNHPLILGMKEGTTPDHQIKGFLLNWYTFAQEVNTAASTIYHRFISWFKVHRELEELTLDVIAEEFNQPGPGGHIRTVQRTCEAAGLTLDEIVHAKLVPEARAWVDFHVRLLTEGTLAETAADFICEGAFGHFAKILFEVLTTRYGFTRQSADYFREHYEADAVGTEDKLSHGKRGTLMLQALLQEGMLEERTGWGVEYTIDITVSMFELLLDGILRRYPAEV